ncbi:hypothetical protein LTR66_001851 [Elasticomyces elasticus]|nr:hypothetical protein LTR50_005985 [Elasticomyces elasticus]KAK4999043.1 hypothetical protein LTR66_001851 [Elasticomyces elasticus]KAK5011162.1 hypothetical protein LTR28_005235 [Elasticomyces elasticus]
MSNSHAVGDSKVPETIQDKAPKGLEESLPNAVHDTGSDTGRKSHAVKDAAGNTDSKVPEALQKAVPEKLEKVLPDSIHNTGGK